MKLTFTHISNAKLRFATIAPQDLPGTLTRIDPATVEGTSTDYPRLVRLSAQMELEFRLNFNECNMIGYPAQRAAAPGGVVRAPISLQRLIRYPINGTMRIQLVNWTTGFQVLPSP